MVILQIGNAAVLVRPVLNCGYRDTNMLFIAPTSSNLNTDSGYLDGHEECNPGPGNLYTRRTSVDAYHEPQSAVVFHYCYDLSYNHTIQADAV